MTNVWTRRLLAGLMAAAFSFTASVAGADGASAPLEHHSNPNKYTIAPVQGHFTYGAAVLDDYHCAPRSSKAPVVMLLHGCAPANFGAADFRQMCVELAERGYYAMFIEYYGAAGAPNCRELALTFNMSLGPETEIPDGTWMHEVLAARDSLVDNPQADSSRLGVIGFSFGGTLGVITAALNPGVITAIVDYYGFSNSRIEDAVAARPNFPPTLILQGDADSHAPVADAIHLHKVIARRQPATEIHVYPEIEHGFNFPAAAGYDRHAAEDAWSRTLSFLRQYLK